MMDPAEAAAAAEDQLAASSSSPHEVVRQLQFPPGYRFLPTEEQLIDVYLRGKIEGRQLPIDVVNEVSILDWQPGSLVEAYKAYGEDKWYFFTRRQPSSSSKKDKEPDRKVKVPGVTATWKATGSLAVIRRNSKAAAGEEKEDDDVVVGTKRVLIYHSTDADEDGKWSMHEYLLHSNTQIGQYALCSIQRKKQRSDTEHKIGGSRKRKNKETEPGKTTTKRKKAAPSAAQQQQHVPPQTPLAVLKQDQQIAQQESSPPVHEQTSLFPLLPLQGYHTDGNHHLAGAGQKPQQESSLLSEYGYGPMSFHFMPPPPQQQGYQTDGNQHPGLSAAMSTLQEPSTPVYGPMSLLSSVQQQQQGYLSGENQHPVGVSAAMMNAGQAYDQQKQCGDMAAPEFNTQLTIREQRPPPSLMCSQPPSSGINNVYGADQSPQLPENYLSFGMPNQPPPVSYKGDYSREHAHDDVLSDAQISSCNSWELDGLQDRQLPQQRGEDAGIGGLEQHAYASQQGGFQPCNSEVLQGRPGGAMFGQEDQIVGLFDDGSQHDQPFATGFEGDAVVASKIDGGGASFSTDDDVSPSDPCDLFLRSELFADAPPEHEIGGEEQDGGDPLSLQSQQELQRLCEQQQQQQTVGTFC